jgi:hypothetical protein
MNLVLHFSFTLSIHDSDIENEEGCNSDTAAEDSAIEEKENDIDETNPNTIQQEKKNTRNTFHATRSGSFSKPSDILTLSVPFFYSSLLSLHKTRSSTDAEFVSVDDVLSRHLRTKLLIYRNNLSSIKL